MNDRNLMILGAMIGAAAGVGVGFLLFTERGRRLRADLQPELEAVMKEALQFGQVMDDLKTGRPGAPASAAAGAGPLVWPRRTQ